MMSGTFISCLFNSNVEFPRIPSGIIKRHITDEANARLAFYLPMPEVTPPIPDAPPRPQLAPGVVDTPLVRVYNFLRESIAIFLFTESFLIQNLRNDVFVVPTRNTVVSGKDNTLKRSLFQPSRRIRLSACDHWDGRTIYQYKCRPTEKC